MYKCKTPQQTLDINGMKFGGQPGQYPPVAICGLFSDEYDAKSLFDPVKGTFNTEEAEKRIAIMQEWSDITKIPATLDALGHTVDAVDKLVNFFADHLEGPFLLDAPSTEIRLPAYELAVEVGLRDRIVYNSLSPEITMRDIQKLKELKVKHILILVINNKNIWPEGRVELLEGTAEEPGLMQLTKDTGAVNIIIDTATLGTAGLAVSNAAIPLVKEKYGLPTGSGTANAPHVWPLDKEYHDTVFGRATYDSFILSTIYAGADWIMPGSLKDANHVFPAMAVAIGLMGYYQGRVEKTPLPKPPNHPLYSYIGKPRVPKFL